MIRNIDVLAEGDFRRTARNRVLRRRVMFLTLATVVLAAAGVYAWQALRPAKYLPRPAYILVFHNNNSLRLKPGDANFRALWMALDDRISEPAGFAALAVRQGDIQQLKAEQTAVELCYEGDIALEFHWKQAVDRRDGIRYLLTPLTGDQTDLLFLAGADGIYRDGPMGTLKDPQAMLTLTNLAIARHQGNAR